MATAVFWYYRYSAFAFLTYLIMMELHEWKSRTIQKKIGWHQNFKRRFLIEVLSSALISLTTVTAVTSGMFFYFMPMDFGYSDWTFYNTIGFLLSLIFMGFVNFGYFMEEWSFSILRGESLQKENIRAKLEALQNQINPHFLFNNFNILNALILNNPPLAHSYLQKMSDVFRYLLKRHRDETVPLSEELQFIDDYLFLIKIRFENVEIRKTLDDDYLTWHIPPATLQILIENAIKHNEVSKRHPLCIEIRTDAFANLTVKNNLQPKKPHESDQGTKTGLYNITERYRFLSDQKPEILQTQEIFSVTVPLLKVAHA